MTRRSSSATRAWRVTLEIYTHTDDEAQLDALTRLHDLFDVRDDEAEG